MHVHQLPFTNKIQEEVTALSITRWYCSLWYLQTLSSMSVTRGGISRVNGKRRELNPPPKHYPTIHHSSNNNNNNNSIKEHYSFHQHQCKIWEQIKMNWLLWWMDSRWAWTNLVYLQHLTRRNKKYHMSPFPGILPTTCFANLMWWDNVSNLWVTVTCMGHCQTITRNVLLHSSRVLYIFFIKRLFSSPSLHFSPSLCLSIFFFFFFLPRAMQWPSLAVQKVYHHPKRNNNMESRQNTGS